jgi:hypothetical protein
MNASRFELNVSVSRDARLAGAIRALVVWAANYAGCPEADAVAFGRHVEEAVADSMQGAEGDSMVPVTLRRHDGPMEVVVDGRVLRLDV